jgi:hypothetical protein
MRREPPGRYFAVTWMPFTDSALAYSSEVQQPREPESWTFPLIVDTWRLGHEVPAPFPW